jgi:hypothetical protein
MTTLDPFQNQRLSEDGYAVLSLKQLGVSISTPQELNEWLIQYPIQWCPYVFGQSRRTQLAGHVYTVSEYSSSLQIPTHHELSYTHHAPKWVVFYAHVPSENGAMHLLDGRLVAESMHRDALWKDKLNLGMIYAKCMPSEPHLGMGQTWKQHFGTNDPDVVDLYLQQNGIDFEWLNNGWLRTEHQRPVLRHSENQSLVWFAQPRLWDLRHRGLTFFQHHRPQRLWPTAIHWGDGTNISKKCFDWLDDFEHKFKVDIHLQQGEILIVDNHRMAHGRGPFEGERQHWVAMGDGSWDKYP